MKIAFIGNFEPPNSTENDLAWSLNQLGHQVFTMQENIWNSDDILEACRTHEIKMLIYVHTHGWLTPGSITLDELWAELDQLKIPTVSFHLDYWFGLERQTDVGSHPFWRTKYVFTADGGSNQWYRDQGINHFWLPPAVVERDCYWAQTRDHFQHDIIFVGSKAYHPEWPYRPRLINWLHDTYGDRFVHYGNDGVRAIRGHELNELYRSTRVVVGDSLNINFDHEDYWSDRVPETIGRGGFLIHPRVKGMEKFYEDKKHLVYYDFNDFDQLKAHIDYYVDDYYEREKIRLEGQRHVKGNHTYTDRMQTLLTTVGKEEGWK